MQGIEVYPVAASARRLTRRTSSIEETDKLFSMMNVSTSDHGNTPSVANPRGVDCRRCVRERGIVGICLCEYQSGSSQGMLLARSLSVPSFEEEEGEVDPLAVFFTKTRLLKDDLRAHFADDEFSESDLCYSRKEDTRRKMKRVANKPLTFAEFNYLYHSCYFGSCVHESFQISLLLGGAKSPELWRTIPRIIKPLLVRLLATTNQLRNFKARYNTDLEAQKHVRKSEKLGMQPQLSPFGMVSSLSKICDDFARTVANTRELTEQARSTMEKFKSFLTMDFFNFVLAINDLVQIDLSPTKVPWMLKASAWLRVVTNSHFKMIIERIPAVESLFMKEQASFEDPRTFVREMQDSSLYTKGIFLVSMFFTTSFFQNASLSTRVAMANCRKFCTDAMSNVGFASAAIDLVVTMIENVTAYAKSGDLADLFGKDILIQQIEKMDHYTAVLTSSTRSHLCEDEFFAFQEIKKYHLKCVKDTNPTLLSNESYRVSRSRFFGAYHDYLNVEPIKKHLKKAAFLMVGPPGIGKSSIVSAIEAGFRRREKISKDVPIVHKMSATKHQKVNPNVKIIVYEDIFSEADTEKDPMLPKMQRFIELEPITLEAASIPDKDKSTFQYECFIGSTNNDGYTFSCSVAGFRKLDRRIYVVWITLTASLVKWCAENKVDPTRYLQDYYYTNLSGRDGKDDFEYTCGYMCNDKVLGKTISFKVKEVLLVTRDRDELVAWMNQRIKKENETKIAQPPDALCIHGSACNDDGTCKFCTVLFERPSDTKEDSSIDGRIRGKVKTRLSDDIPTAEKIVVNELAESLRMKEELVVKERERLRRNAQNPNPLSKIILSEPDLDDYAPSLSRRLFETVPPDDEAYRTPYSDSRFETQSGLVDLAQAVDAAGAKVVKVVNTGVRKLLGLNHPVVTEAMAVIADGVEEDPYSSTAEQCSIFGFEKENDYSGLYNMTEDNKALRAVVRIAAGYLVIQMGIQLLKIAAHLLRGEKSVPQELLSGTINNVDPTVKPVMPIMAKVPPWTAKQTPKSVISIARSGRRLFGIHMTMNIVTLPYHLLQHPDTKEYVPKGTLDLGQGRFVDYDVLNTYRPNERCDKVFVYVGTLPGAPMGAYDELLDEHPPVMDAQCKGQEFQLIVGDGKYTGYGLDTESGDCGLPYMSGGKLIAMHTHALVSSTGKGHITYGSPLFKKEVDEVISVFAGRGLLTVKPCRVVDQMITQLIDESCPDGSPPGDCGHVLATMSEEDMIAKDICFLGKLKFRGTGKMTCHQTTLYPLFSEYLTEPCVGPHTGHALESAGYVSPFTKQLLFNQQKVSLRMYKAAEFIAMSWPVPREKYGPLGIVQAMCGDQRNVYINGIDLKTSVGPQLRMHGVTKETLFRKEKDGSFTPHPELLKRIHVLENEILEGRFSPTLEQTCLKDEVLKMSKVAEGGGRLFAACEKSALIIEKKWLMPLIACLTAAWRETGFVHALNPGSKDWEDFAQLLLALSGLILDADMKTYDMSHGVLNAPAVHSIYVYAKRFGYTETEAQMAGRVALAFFIRVRIVEGYIFYGSVRLASGRLLTLFLNGLINQILGTSWTMSLCEEYGYEFKGGDRFMPVVGDDSLLTLSKRLMQHSPKATDYVEYVREAGYTMTSADKKSEVSFKPIGEISIVKRRFEWDDELKQHIAPLEMPSIVKALCYCTSVTIPQVLRDSSAVLCMSKELALHPLSVTQPFYDKFKQAGLKFFDREAVRLALKQNTLVLWEYQADETLAAAEQAASCVAHGDQSQTWEVEHVKHHLQGTQSESPPQEGITLIDRSCLNGPPRGQQCYQSPNLWKTILCALVSTWMLMRLTELNSSMTNEVYKSPEVALYNTVATNSLEKVQEITPGRVFTNKPAEIDFRKMAGVPRKIATLSWTTSTALQSLDLSALWLSDSVVRKMTTNFAAFRGEPRVYIATTGSSYCIGMMRVYAVPVRQYDATHYNTTRGVGRMPNQDTQHIALLGGHIKSAVYPHVDIDASCVCTHELKLPYIGQRPFASQDGDYFLFFQPLNTLSRADAVAPDAIVMTITLAYDNCDFAVMVEQAGDDEPGLVSSGLRYASRLGRLFHSPYSKILDMGANVAESFGYSRPPVDVSLKTVSGKFGPMAAVSGVGDMVYHLGLDQRELVSQEDTSLPGGHVGGILDICRKTNHLYSVWDTALGTAQVLGPIFNTTFGTQLYMPPISAMTSMFECWRGGLKVTLRFQSSPLIRTRFGVNWWDADAGGTATHYVSNGSIPGYQVDVCGTTEFTFEIPYSRLVYLTQTADDDTYTPHYPYYFAVYVLDGPVGPVGASVPGYDVFISPMNDFELVYPTTRIMNSLMVMQSGNDMSGSKVTSCEELAKRGCKVVHTTNSVGRYELSYPADGVPVMTGLAMGSGSDTAALTLLGWSFHRWFIDHSFGYIGSSVWRGYGSYATAGSSPSISTDIIRASTTFSVPGCASVDSFGSTNSIKDAQTGNGCQLFKDGVFEINAPSRAQEVFKASPCPVAGNIAATMRMQCIHLQVPLNASYNNAQFDLFHSAGDDVRYGMYIQPTYRRRD